MPGPISFQLTTVGKMFVASLIGWMVHGSKLNWKIKGDPKKVEAMAKAILSSKRFQDEIKKPGATVESVVEKLNLKNMNASAFQTLTGYPWPI